MTGIYAVGALILLILAVVVAAYLKGRGAGGDAATTKVATETVAVQKKMDQAAAKSDPTKAGVKKSLEEGTF